MNLKTVGVASQKVQASKAKRCEVGRVDFATANRPVNPQGLTQKIDLGDLLMNTCGTKSITVIVSLNTHFESSPRFQKVCILCTTGWLVIFSGKPNPHACDMQRHESPPSWDAQKSWATLIEEILLFTGFYSEWLLPTVSVSWIFISGSGNRLGIV